MIIGKGLIAKLFTDHDRGDVIFFASGVSNSSETDPAQFTREENLVAKALLENPGEAVHLLQYMQYLRLFQNQQRLRAAQTPYGRTCENPGGEIFDP